ncbi:plasmid mobilization relaxosome protein MobC [Flavobacterium sp. DG2-3]|uniref:plasmid mobilization protein n=1 Tax=Flavobacterium sp. DG2-3 TaxID=3068317 RepID=UPI00273D1069|nr:plasmid mobilization relaxosome protein MobC [Flavobacterium sp. DG2-3]MDP5198998.1 plasmid mobilization relaxosome protein MobC [Flavobacterium sp. DG2-3]
MKEKNTNRIKWVHLRLTTEEMNLLQRRFEKSLCPKLSDFARKNMLGKPVILKYRNQSVDDFILEISRLRADLNAVGNNYNQMVKKLHTLQQIPEFRDWIYACLEQKEILFDSIEKIKNCVLKLAEKWLQ